MSNTNPHIHITENVFRKIQSPANKSHSPMIIGLRYVIKDGLKVFFTLEYELELILREGEIPSTLPYTYHAVGMYSIMFDIGWKSG